MTLTGRRVSPKYDLTALFDISACARCTSAQARSSWLTVAGGWRPSAAAHSVGEPPAVSTSATVCQRMLSSRSRRHEAPPVPPSPLLHGSKQWRRRDLPLIPLADRASEASASKGVRTDTRLPRGATSLNGLIVCATPDPRRPPECHRHERAAQRAARVTCGSGAGEWSVSLPDTPVRVGPGR